MNWLLDHLQIVVAIAGAFAFWLKQRGESKKKAAQSTRPVQPRTMADGDEADRARKIREEILRKIAERRGGANPVAREKQDQRKKSEPPPLLRPVSPLDPFGGPGRTIARREETVASLPSATVQTDSDEAVLARQERLAQQLRDLEAQRAIAQRRATAQTEVTRAAEEVLTRAASNVRRELRDPRTVRHAIILREVLGTPAGLR